MVKSFKYKRLKGRFILSKKFLGFGIMLDLQPAYAMEKIDFFLWIDLIWLRFWIERINKNDYNKMKF